MYRLSIKISIKKIFLSILIILLFTNVIRLNSTSQVSHQLIYQVSNSEEAKFLSEKYDITILKERYNGIVTYEVSDEAIIPELLDMGFCYNNLSKTQLLPIIKKSDPFISKQYALSMMQTFEAWDINSGNSDVIVAIIDTGIDINHEEFQGRLSPLSYNSYERKVGLEAVQDDNGHGTLVAGVIAANKDNYLGIAGIAQNVQLLIIKANVPNLDKGQFYDDSLIEGIYYAVDHGASVINMSLGGPNNNYLMEKAVNYAYENGVAIVAAAGNDGKDENNYPAAFINTISVSAVDENKELADYSNFGSSIIIAAPGTNIYSSDRNNTYRAVSGTSMAAPQVSGVIALMFSHFPDISLDELIARLTLSSIDLGIVGKDEQFGYGLVNTFEALTKEIVNVQFETFNASQVDSIFLNKGSFLPVPSEPILEGSFFDGWYLDTLFNQPVDINNLVVNQDLVLYAKFTENFHQVTFVTEGSQVLPIIVAHGETFEIPKPSLEYHDFVMWTLDIEGTIKYNQEPVTQDLILYAQFIPTVFTINFITSDQTINPIEAIYLDKITLPTPQRLNYEFRGWYTEEELINEFNESYITKDLRLYPKFIHISYKDIYLNSGVDTIKVGQLWIDGGLTNLVEDFHVIVTGNVNNEQVGRYQITYSVYHQKTLIKELSRFVRVVEKDPVITINLNPSVSTINIGEEYIDTSVSTNSNNIEIINNIDSSKVGTYQVIYKINLDSYTVIKTRYVHVLDNNQNQEPILYLLPKRKEDLIEA